VFIVKVIYLLVECCLVKICNNNYDTAASCIKFHRESVSNKSSVEFYSTAQELFRSNVESYDRNSQELIMKKYSIKVDKNEIEASHTVCRTVFLYLWGITDHLWRNCSNIYKQNPEYRGGVIENVKKYNDDNISLNTYAEAEAIFKKHLPGEAIGNLYSVVTYKLNC
jgi:hypothetical protein